MISIAYCVRPLAVFISPEPICPGTAHSAKIFAESGEIIVVALYRSLLIEILCAALTSTVLHVVPVGLYHSMAIVSGVLTTPAALSLRMGIFFVVVSCADATRALIASITAAETSL
jgi:hypothetical protein